MLYHLLVPLSDQFSVLNVFRYLTFRTGGAVITALAIGFLIGPAMIRMLRQQQSEGQPIRDDGPDTHPLTKKGTLTMGGLLILVALVATTLLWADLRNRYVWATLGVTVAFGVVGFIDDYIKVVQKHSRGLSGRIKLLFEVAIATEIGRAHV